MGNFKDGFVRVVGLRNGFVRVGQMGCDMFEKWFLEILGMGVCSNRVSSYSG